MFTILDQAASDIPGTLFPGSDGDVSIKVSNPNTGPFTITDATFGTVSSFNGNCSSDVLTLTDQHGLSLGPVPAGGTMVLSLHNAAHLAANAPNVCQSNVFQVATAITGTVG